MALYAHGLLGLRECTVNPAYVDVSWLADHRHDVVVLDASVQRDRDVDGSSTYRSGAEEFRRDGHIPGSVHADLVVDLSAPDAHALDGKPRFPRPDATAFADSLGRLGVGPGAFVVVYDRTNGVWAGRLVWMLRSYGVKSSAVLLGGLQAWAASGREVGVGDAVADPTSPPVLLARPGGFVDTDEVQRIVEQGRRGAEPPSVLVNVLRPEVYAGDETPYGIPGHIPGSINRPYADLLAGAETITEPGAASAGLPDGSRPITYCGSGITAAAYALALESVGVTDVAVYDGSLSEWLDDPARPMTTAESTIADATTTNGPVHD